ncbi:hypothetical protein SKAU_G00288110 [Synaphobranchus kaupii]|uniref:Glycosyltransferase 2-like domain-containing protein n=1 Tax=Synaphobranchus kaupii TaxID=118154 RepID=A0A9Q1ETA6_SYNKA|nr:hypothetical protein SKAU_G00288110 [Synaphobranchus kaupii]
METGQCASPPLHRIYNPMPNVTRPRTSCSCPSSGFGLRQYVDKNKFNDIVRRRAEALAKDRVRRKTILNELLLAPPNSPLQYPIQGFIVSPLKKSIIPGLSVHTVEKQNYQVTLSVSSGVLAVEDLQEKDKVKGQGEKVLSISVSSLQSLNDLLGRISYRSTVYSIKSGDLDVNSQVTVTTKTFLRYPEVNYLIKSIRKFYKDIKIIIADDSLEPQKVNGTNIEQYFMPPAQGWFAGRNLAVSQVTTKYFLWVDDDFYFTSNTSIERFVEVMESMPELDVVAGSVGMYANSFTLIYDEGDEEGGCLTRVKGNYQPIPSIPNCFFTSGVINFFLARTDAVRKVGFDPLLKRVGHSEFFMDGLGELLVAICPEVGLNHQRRRANGKYRKFRIPPKSDTNGKLYLHFFKNHLKCMKW